MLYSRPSVDTPTCLGASPATKQALGVWAVWVAATASAFTLALALGSNVPFWDDWEYVPVLTGYQPLTPSVLWGLHNEHRLPLSRVLYIVAFHLGGGDFRAIMLVNVGLLSAAAALLVRAAGRARGSASWTDAVLPLLLLHPGHEENLLWSFNILIVLPVFLASVALAAIVSIRDTLGRRRVLVIGTAAVLMQLCSASGLILGSAFGAWLLWRSTAGRSVAGDPAGAGRRLSGMFGSLCLLLGVLYLVHYRGNPTHPQPGGLAAAVRSTAEVLTMALGPAATTIGPPAVILIFALVMGTALAVAAWWWRSPGRRLPAEGLLAALAACAGLVLAIGWGRSGFPIGAGRAPRYVTLAVPVVIWSYMAWCRIPAPRVGRAVQIGLLGACVALLPGNISLGLAGGRDRQQRLESLVRDLEQGMTPELAAKRHADEIYPSPPTLRARLEMLRARRLGPFTHAQRAVNFQRYYPFLHAPLVRLEPGIIPPHEASVRHRPVLVVHADGAAVFDVRPGLRRAEGRFGVLPGFGTGPFPPGGPTFDGTYFTVAFRRDDGREEEMFAALLNPSTRAQDGRAHPFEVTLPGVAGELILRTRFGPPGTPSNGFEDWGYWSDVVLY